MYGIISEQPAYIDFVLPFLCKPEPYEFWSTEKRAKSSSGWTPVMRDFSITLPRLLDGSIATSPDASSKRTEM